MVVRPGASPALVEAGRKFVEALGGNGDSLRLIGDAQP
jgi:hypothetical protein